VKDEGRRTKDKGQGTRVEGRSPNASHVPTPIAIAVVEQNGAVLVGRRGPSASLANLWEFPGGKIESGESPAAAAVRECLEETGLNVEVVALLSEQIEQYEHACVRLHFFHCRPLRPAVEVRTPFRWVSRSELASLPFPRGNRHLLARLIRDST
jgi:mutator protein MutT